MSLSPFQLFLPTSSGFLFSVLEENQVFSKPDIRGKRVVGGPHFEESVLINVPEPLPINPELLSPVPRHHTYVILSFLQLCFLLLVVKFIIGGDDPFEEVPPLLGGFLPKPTREPRLLLRVEDQLSIQVVLGVFDLQGFYLTKSSLPHHYPRNHRLGSPQLNLLAISELHIHWTIPMGMGCVCSDVSLSFQVSIDFEIVRVFVPHVVRRDRWMVRNLLHDNLVLA
mmetsp:Transcript_1830/g.1748  ORF Transcript_1830/g.1748 Transcript_1830/m.1748 type:complete len:225 (-) Transcript_1830:351-1025(-)